MKIKKIIVALLFIIIAGIVAVVIWKRTTAQFYYAGTIEATRIDVPSRLASVIEGVDVAEGIRVEKGQSLVRLSCEDIKIQSDLSTATFKRAQRLVQAGSMPRENFDQLKAKNDEINLKMDWCSIQSPAAGTVLSTYYEPGEWVSPGSKLLTVANLEDVWAYIYVPQSLLARIRLGMRVEGFLPELNMHRLEGTIVKINEEAEFTPKNVQTRDERTRLVFGIKILFRNQEGLLKPGMPIEVASLAGESHE